MLLDWIWFVIGPEVGIVVGLSVFIVGISVGMLVGICVAPSVLCVGSVCGFEGNILRCFERC